MGPELNEWMFHLFNFRQKENEWLQRLEKGTREWNIQTFGDRDKYWDLLKINNTLEEEYNYGLIVRDLSIDQIILELVLQNEEEVNLAFFLGYEKLDKNAQYRIQRHSKYYVFEAYLSKGDNNKGRKLIFEKLYSSESKSLPINNNNNRFSDIHSDFKIFQKSHLIGFNSNIKMGLFEDKNKYLNLILKNQSLLPVLSKYDDLEEKLEKVGLKQIEIKKNEYKFWLTNDSNGKDKKIILEDKDSIIHKAFALSLIHI